MYDSRIMIVDDETDILNLCEKALSLEGFVNIVKLNYGESAIAECRRRLPDIIIIDISMPGIDGIETVRTIKRFADCPVMFLSARNDEVDRLMGLAVGGDDYVTKPFSPKEVAYRVKAILRRTKGLSDFKQGEVFSFGDIRIDTEGCTVTKNGTEVELTAKEYEILTFLAQNMGRVISKERLYEKIWKEDCLGCDNVIMVHIRHLREKLEDNPQSPRYLITMKGLGYRLVGTHE